MDTQEKFEQQLSEILDASSGQTPEHKKIPAQQPDVTSLTPTLTDKKKNSLPELIIRIAAVLLVLALLYFFGSQMAYR